MVRVGVRGDVLFLQDIDISTRSVNTPVLVAEYEEDGEEDASNKDDGDQSRDQGRGRGAGWWSRRLMLGLA